MWAGNEACEPVTWQECKLVPKTVKFIVPEINCTDGQEVRSCSQQWEIVLCEWLSQGKARKALTLQIKSLST